MAAKDISVVQMPTRKHELMNWIKTYEGRAEQSILFRV